jgi:L-ascorbate 6-phosphate lactonase
MVPVPFAPEDVSEADAILITHEHGDHIHGPSQAPILADTDATLYAPGDTLDIVNDQGWTDRWDVESDQFVAVGSGDDLEIGSLSVHVEEANDPGSTDPVSYVIEHEKGTIFHGGDSSLCEAFERIGETYDIDLGILAYGSGGMLTDPDTGERSPVAWYNDSNDIILAAYQLQLDRLLPSHWDIWKGMTADPTTLVERRRGFEYPAEIEYAEIGDQVDVPDGGRW